jgi:hypothetical protein
MLYRGKGEKSLVLDIAFDGQQTRFVFIAPGGNFEQNMSRMFVGNLFWAD